MARFDVFRNPGRQREIIPFVVVLQNARFDPASTRFVAPLVRGDAARVAEPYLAPRFIIEGAEVILDAFISQALRTDVV